MRRWRRRRPIFRFVLLPLMIVYCRFRAAAMPYAVIDFSAFMPLFFADAAAMPPAYACLPLLLATMLMPLYAATP
jgi:hypothetical protein